MITKRTEEVKEERKKDDLNGQRRKERQTDRKKESLV